MSCPTAQRRARQPRAAPRTHDTSRNLLIQIEPFIHAPSTSSRLRTTRATLVHTQPTCLHLRTTSYLSRTRPQGDTIPLATCASLSSRLSISQSSVHLQSGVVRHAPKDTGPGSPGCISVTVCGHGYPSASFCLFSSLLHICFGRQSDARTPRLPVHLLRQRRRPPLRNLLSIPGGGGGGGAVLGIHLSGKTQNCITTLSTLDC